MPAFSELGPGLRRLEQTVGEGLFKLAGAECGLRDEFGALSEKMFKYTAVLDWRSRSLEVIDE